MMFDTPSPVDIKKVFEILGRQFETFQTPIIDLIKERTDDPFKVLVGTILSARTRDAVTALVTRQLFAVVHNVSDLAGIPEDELEAIIRPIGFFRAKTRHLKALPAVLMERFGGLVPKTIEELTQLPGVGRKTANLVLAVGFRIPAVCVDVHVHRIMNRLGYVRTKTPLETEMTLRKIMPQHLWLDFNSFFVAFGQNRCFPLNPVCSDCPVIGYCGRIGVKTRHIPKQNR